MLYVPGEILTQKNIDQGSYLFKGSEGSWGWTCHHDHCQQRNMKDVALKLKSCNRALRKIHSQALGKNWNKRK